MKNKTLVIMFLAAALLISSSVMASKVSKVELTNVNGSTVAAIGVEGTISFTHQTEVAKDGKPFRVIVDVLDATFNLGSHKYTNVPACPVKGIRSSQFAVNPQKIVRVVFDMDTDRTYMVDTKNNSIVLTFNDNTASFKSWSSVNSKPVKKPVLTKIPKAAPKKVVAKTAPKKVVKKQVATAKPKAVPKKVVSVTKTQPKSVASVNKSIENDRKSSLQGKADKSVVTKKAAVKAQPKKVVASKPAPKKEVVKAQPKKVVASKPAPKKISSSKVQKQFSEKPAASVKSAPANKATAKASSTVKKVEKPAAKKLANNSKSKANNKSVAKNETKAKAAEKSSTSRFRRSPAMSKKIQGTMVAEFPKRLVIKYKARNKRDPFETLINEAKVYNDPVEKRVPNVEGLRLVGIIESDDTGNRALFEDNTGFGYILTSGDKVRNGYVLRIDDDRVFFQIFEYGWSRTVSLVLES